MKKSILLLFLISIAHLSIAQPETHFVTTWKTDNPGGINSTSINIPTAFPMVDYDYDVDWGDGNGFSEFGVSNDAFHDYGSSGTYTVRIRGDFPRIYFENALFDHQKLLNVDQWGTIEWSSMEGAFTNCANLGSGPAAIDAPDLTGVTSMREMFKNASSFNHNINSWNVSNVTDMASMFSNAVSFNQDLSNWNVSNVLTMQSMFHSAISFNQIFSNGNVSNVSDMSQMFFGASSFNQNLSSWVVSSVTSFSSMFFGASSFNGQMDGWAPNSPSSMIGMFDNATSFNQDLSSWDVSSVTNTVAMFNGAVSFNQDIGNWNVSNVNNMQNMFRDATAFDQNLSNWNVSNVTNMIFMFENVTLSTANYDAMLIAWEAQSLQSNVNFHAGNSLYCEGADARQSMIDNDMWGIIDGGLFCVIPEDDFVTTWQTDNFGASNNSSIRFEIPFGVEVMIDWDNDGSFDEMGLSGVISHDFGVAGTYTIRIESLDNYDFRFVLGAGDQEKLLRVDQWGSNQWEELIEMFADCVNLTIPAIDAPDFSNANASLFMFASCHSFNNPVNHWDVSPLTDTRSMFVNASSFNQPLDQWDVSNVNDMYGMFDGASAFDQDVSMWDVSNVNDMEYMFQNVQLSVENYDALLIGWNNQVLQSGVNFDGGNSQYCLGAVARQNMIEDDLWNIVDGGSLLLTVSNVPEDTVIVCGQVIPNDAPTFNDGNLSGLNINFEETESGNGCERTITRTWTASDDCGNEISTTQILTVIINPDYFVTSWKTDRPEIRDSLNITIPISSGGGYNYDVDWDADGIFDDIGLTSSVTHEFGVTGEFTVIIRGDFPRIYFNGNNYYNPNSYNPTHSSSIRNNNALKISSIDQWGSIEWTSMRRAFSGCENLQGLALDEPDLSNVTDAYKMFQRATTFNQDINDWDVQTIEDMTGMFEKAKAFNQPLDTWDVSSVVKMNRMFGYADIFNQDISNWDVSSVKNMSGMFIGAKLFNQDISPWIVNTVTDMSYMFYDADAFNHEISYNPAQDTWNVGNVEYMNYMFGYADIFNQDISNWDVSTVKNMSGMFGGAKLFNQDISPWIVNTVTDMSYMFYDADAFNQDISSWIIESVNNMAYMFAYNALFNQDISIWEVENVTNMRGMFSDVGSFNQDISNWNIEKVTDMGYMFRNADIFTHDITSWNPISVIRMDGMFKSNQTFNQDISSWEVGTVITMEQMFRNASTFNHNLSTWSVGSVTNMKEMFEGAYAFDHDIGSWDITSVTTMEEMFNFSGLSLENYDALLIGWESQDVQNDVPFDAGPSNYCAGLQARQNLLADHNWTISDLTSNCPGANPSIGDYIWNDVNPDGRQGYYYVGIYNWQYQEVGMPGIQVKLKSSGPDNMFNTTDDIIVDQTVSEGDGQYNFIEVEPGEYVIEFDINSLPTDMIFTQQDQGTDTYDSDVDEFGRTAPFTLTATQDNDLSIDMGVAVQGAEFLFVSENFVSTWQTDNPGTSSNTSITIPTFPGEDYLYDVDWNNDGTFDEFGLTEDVTHDFGTAGEHEIQIQGIFPRIYFNNGGDKAKIIDIQSWGNILWSSMEDAFHGCVNLNSTAFIPPDLTEVSDMSRMFQDASSFNGDLQYWETETILEMDDMFNGATSFNSDISQWEVFFVQNMSGMFQNANSFNQDLSSWGTFFAQDMSFMFSGASSFDQDLSGWFVEEAIDISFMFESASLFDSDLSEWNVANVIDMSSMFANATSFDQDLGAWDVTSVFSMDNMLDGVQLSTPNYDALLTGWSPQTLQPGVTFDGGNSQFCEGAAARQSMIDNDMWIITDGDEDPLCSTACYQTDKDILQQLHLDLGEPILTGWNFSPTTILDETWQGIGMTDDGGCQVDSLNLNNLGLVGSIDEIGNLSALRYLRIGNNSFPAGIPSTFENHSSLEYINLTDNEMDGTGIPAFLGTIPTLQYLYLGVNDFGGTIPSSLGNLTNLKVLALDGNQLTGEIPVGMLDADMADMASLYLYNNVNLTGELTEEMGMMPSIQAFWIQNNNFVGCIPASFINYCGEDVRIQDNDLLLNNDFATFCSNGVGVCQPDCPTDFDNDTDTDGDDFAIFLGNYGLDCENPFCATDLDSDGDTDGDDFAIFLGNYGLDCE